MKKSVMTKVLALAVATTMVFSLAACDGGSKKDKDDSDDEDIEESEDEDEEEEDEDPTPTPEPTATPTPTPEPEPETWFEAQDLTITPQGDFDLDTEWLYTDDSLSVSGATTVPCSVNIYETTEGADEGYKKVVAEFVIDYTDKFFYDYGDFYAYPQNGVDNYPSTWVSVFDRYTGVTFEPGDIMVPIEIDGKTYDITCTFDWNIVAEYEGDVEAADYCTVTVICPVDYDGAVFYIGHGNGGESNVGGQDIDFTKKLYTIDEIPCYPTNGFPYFFFSASNK